MSKREDIFAALYALLMAPPLVLAFTADTVAGSAVLSNVSNAAALRKGLPLFGPGVPDGAVVATTTPTVTMGLKGWAPDPAVTDAELRVPVTTPALATATGTGVALRQGLRTTGRRVPFINRVPKMPGLFLRNTDDDYPGRVALAAPARVTLNGEIWLYAKALDNQVPGDVLDPLIEAVEERLKPSPAIGVITLGGLVAHTWIEGMIERNPGDLDGNAIAVIDVRILVPGLV